MDVVMSDGTSTSSSQPEKGHSSAKKRNLTLDLNASSAQNHLAVPTTALDFRTSPGFILTSPDVQMLQLGSPELEKYILQGLMGQNTPTPTQLVFPKNVTEEQESYAKGFVDALNALHRSGMAYNVVNPGTGNAFPINNASAQTLFPQFFTVPNQQQFVQPQLMIQPNQMMQVQPKQEPYSPSVSPAPSDPQTVPSDRGSTKSSTNSSTGTSPINMETQGKMKVERKRERNRLAAAKCRMRKLERISQLEERVKELKDQNSSLTDTSAHLRNDLATLKQELLNHMQSGCQLILSQQMIQSLQSLQQE